MSEQSTSASFEACWEAVGHRERRRLLLALLHGGADGNRTVSLGQLDTEAEDDPPELSMHHIHLPKLEASGFVDADRERGSVTVGPRFEEIRPLLELLDDNRCRLPDGWV